MAVAKVKDPLAVIELVKANPILWDSRNDDYKMTDKKAVIWADIATKLNVSTGKHIVLLCCTMLLKPDTFFMKSI